MKISVIIPVYNAEKYVKKAVESALAQPETGEIILIEDCSPDNALKVCEELEQKYEIVKLYQHPDKKNHGAGATRNLGIEKAKNDYIAFLDADDYYLPKRFRAENEIFTNHPEAEGVYGALGIRFYSDEGKRKFERALVNKDLTTVSSSVGHREILLVLLGISNKARGHFHLDCLTVRKSVFNKTGPFSTRLRLSQDTDFIIKLAATSRILAGIVDKAIAIRGVHDDNRVSNKENLERYRAELYESLYKWGKDNEMPKKALDEIWDKYLVWKTLHNNIFRNIILLALSFFYNKRLFYTSRLFNQAVVNTFGLNSFAKSIIRIKEKLQSTLTDKAI